MFFPIGNVIVLYMKIRTVGDIAELVKKRRQELGLTQAETAKLCGVGNRFFSELENGKKTLQIEKVFHIVTMLGIDLTAETREALNKSVFFPRN